MMPKQRTLLIAVASVIALATSAGIWVIVANDFAIHEEQVIVPGSAEPLHGVLALPPQGKGPYGLVAFVHGDGPADATRDSFYRPIWESLARAGYASLAWNKPGIDGAPGNWLNQSMHDRATEAEAAITCARGRSDIDPKRIGAWGISQGGWVVPELAVRQPDMQFVILVGAAANWLRQGEYNLVAEIRVPRTALREQASTMSTGSAPSWSPPSRRARYTHPGTWITSDTMLNRPTAGR